MIVRRLHGLLESLYDVESHCDIADYLVTDRAHLNGLQPDNDSRCNEEQLLLAQTEDGAGMSLPFRRVPYRSIARGTPRWGLPPRVENGASPSHARHTKQNTRPPLPFATDA